MNFLPTFDRQHVLYPKFHNWLGDKFDIYAITQDKLLSEAKDLAHQDGHVRALPQSPQVDTRRRGSETDRLMLADIRAHGKSQQIERAERLGIAQAEVSRSTNRLRDAFHIVMIRRSASGTEFTLTATGHQRLREAV